MSRIVYFQHGNPDYKGEQEFFGPPTWVEKVENPPGTVIQEAGFYCDYSGSSDESVFPIHTPLVVVKDRRTRVTGRELIALFDSRDEAIWDKVEGSAATEAKDFREAVARNLDRRVSLTATFITDAFALMVPSICTQDDIDFVSLGIEL